MIREFGVAPCGAKAQAIALDNGAVSVEVLTYGAVLRGLRLAGVDRSLTLDQPDLDAYIAVGAHMGAVAGRVANRIKDAKLPLSGRIYDLDFNGKAACLHGGRRGFGVRVWRLEDHGPTHATLSLYSPDGDMGFPGAVVARCRYRLDGPALHIDLSVKAEAPTVAALATHSYFNLSGAPTIDDHALSIDAAARTLTDPALIPTGAVEPVAGEHDFRALRPIGARAYDGNYCLAAAPLPEPVEVARLAAGGVSLAIETDAPGLQFYTGDGLPTPRAGLCLEPQHWPDAPNNPHFPSIALAAGETWRQRTAYRLEANEAR